MASNSPVSSSEADDTFLSGVSAALSSEIKLPSSAISSGENDSTDRFSGSDSVLCTFLVLDPSSLMRQIISETPGTTGTGVSALARIAL